MRWAQAINGISLSEKYAQWRTYDAKPDGSGIYALVCEKNESMRMTQAELEQHPRWRNFGDEAPDHPPMNGWLAVPLVGRDGRNLGLIQLSDKYDGDFAAEDEDVLTQLAQFASSAMENARLYEEARAANQAKDDFFAALSHELRTPMTSIIGWTRLLSMDVNRETLEEAVASITTSASTQAQLVDDLLDVSRITAGKFSVERRPLDMSALVEEAVTAMRPSASDKGVALVVDVSGSGLVDGDPVRLRQVVSNLLSNAIKFTPRGGIVTTSFAITGTSVTLRVTDTGEGIPRDFLPHVFDRHAQRVSGRHGGLGLGLAIVQKIVEQHGGTVSADSAGEGKGATFTVSIPVSGQGSK